MTGTRVTSLGHAGLAIEADGLRLLCDPWLSPGGAFLGAWFPYPDNSHLRTDPRLDCDWVVVSHEHLDHLDIAFLAGLPPRVRVVIPRYPSPSLARRLQQGGVHHIVQVEAWHRLSLNDRGDWLTVIPEVSPMCHDAGVLIFAGGHSVLHANDARLSVAQVRRASIECGGPLDLFAVQASGASWHPICYEYPPEVVERLSWEKRVSKLKAVTRLIRATSPQFVLPYAGPPCFLDPALRRHNAGISATGIFPDQGDVVAWLAEHLPAQNARRLMPGDSLHLPSGVIHADAHWEGWAQRDQSDYLESYAESRADEIAQIHASHPDPSHDLAEQFGEHMARLGELSPYFGERIEMVVRFDVSGQAGGRWDVHMSPTGFRVDLDGKTKEPGYRFAVEARWIADVLSGAIGWEDLLLSLRFSARRQVDVYNDYLIGLLKHADASALLAVQAFETARDPYETVALGEGAERYEVSRYCPHAGEDLAESAVISDGKLRCLGHNFDFDLETGACLNARCDPIVVKARPQTQQSAPGRLLNR